MIEKGYSFRDVSHNPIYGHSIRVELSQLSREDMKLALLELNSLSFLAYGHSDDGKKAFLEAGLGANVDSLESTVQTLTNFLEKKGYVSKTDLIKD